MTFIYVCVCIYYEWVSVHMYGCGWRSEHNLSVVPQELSTLLLRQCVSVALGLQASQAVPQLPQIQISTQTLY